jgi:hypothetical protein
MGKILDRLKAGAPSYAIEEIGDGIVLIRTPAHAETFSMLVRDLLNTSGEEFVALPTTDGSGYERVVLLPL